MDFAVQDDHRVKLKGEKRVMEHEGDCDTNCNWCTWKDPQKIGKRTGRLRNQRIRRDHPDYSITKIGQNTEKSPGDLRRFAVTQTAVEEHQLKLGWKTLKKVKYIICLGNLMQKILSDLEIQTDYPLQTRKVEQVLINKKIGNPEKQEIYGRIEIFQTPSLEWLE